MSRTLAKELEKKDYHVLRIFQSDTFEKELESAKQLKKEKAILSYLLFPIEWVNKEPNYFQPKKGYHAIYMKINPERKDLGLCCERYAVPGISIMTGNKMSWPFSGSRICKKN